MKDVTLTWVIGEEHHGLAVREYVREVQGVSRRALTSIKHNGGKITVNNIPVTVRHQLQKGDFLELIFPSEKRGNGLIPEYFPLSIAYEDDHIIVIDKPPFMATIPSKEHPTGSLANALVHLYNERKLNYTVHIVNRLDRNTSGLLLVAKHSHAHYLFSEQQKEYQVQRTYEAVVHGIVEPSSGTIDVPIGRKEGSIIERQVRVDGQRAITHYTVKKKLPERSLVSITLATGRTHQIRVHMSSMGHPLLGDDLYGGETTKINRQALHSTRLAFFHPIEKKDLAFYSPLPGDMTALLS